MGSWRRNREAVKPLRPVWPTLRRATALLWPHRLLVSGYLVTIGISTLPGLGQPLLIREIIDDALPNQDGARVNLLIAIMLGLVLVGAFNGTLQTFLSNQMSHSVLFDLRDRLYQRLTSMPLRWFTSSRTGESLSRITNDVNAVQGVVGGTIGEVVSNIVTLVTTFALMMVLDWRLALFTILFVPLFSVPARMVGNMQRRVLGEAQEQLADLNNQMQETLSVSGALLVKTSGRQAHEIDVFQRTARNIRNLNIRRAMIGRWFGMMMGLFASIAPAVVYWYGGHRVIGGETSLGTVVALATLMTRMFGPISSLMTVHVTALSSIALFERIFDYLDLEPEISDAPGAATLKDVRGEVRFENVTFSYEADTYPTLYDVSFTVPAGKFAALVGPTGAGKTTIAYLLPRLYDADSGRISIDGHDVREVTLDSLSAAIGMVNQEPFLFHTSIRENIRYARPEATDEEVEKVARAANIQQFIAGLPQGYDTIVGERGYRLSGGEKQRVAIARALLKDPAILILDEATSSVDTATERAIQEALDRVTTGRTVLAIAHRLSTVLTADIILVVENGRIVESGTHAELLARGGTYAHLYRLQFGEPEPLLT